MNMFANINIDECVKMHFQHSKMFDLSFVLLFIFLRDILTERGCAARTGEKAQPAEH